MRPVYHTPSSRMPQNQEHYSYFEEPLGSCWKTSTRKVSRKNTVWWRIVSLHPDDRSVLYSTDSFFWCFWSGRIERYVCSKCLYFPESSGQCSKVVLNRRWIKEYLEGFSSGNTEYPQMETSSNGRENQMENASRVNFRTTLVNNAICKSHKHMKCSF